MPDEKELDLRHNVGDAVQLQFVPGPEGERYYVKLLGFNSGKSIIVSKPIIEGVSVAVEIGQEFIVRLISGQSAQGFNAHVLSSSKTPYPHMHLTFPAHLQSATIRKAERVDCSLIVTVKNISSSNHQAKPKSASLSNISSAGARLTTNESIGEQGEMIDMQCKIVVAKITQYLNITGKIKRELKKDDDFHTKFEYGIEFVFGNDTDKVLLHAFIYEQLLNI